MAFKAVKIFIGIFIILVVIGMSIGGCSQQPEKYTGPIEDITIAVSKLEATTLVRIALKNGYFEEQGLNVKMTEQDLGKFSLQEVFDGRADIATVAETPVVKNSFKRDDFRIFATIHKSSTNVKLIARKDHGINSVQDLKGKKVGTTVGTVGEFFLSSFLLYSGLSVKDIELIDEKPAALFEMLQAGEIDAFALREPHVYRAQENLGDVAIVFVRDDVYAATFNVVALTDFIKAKPQIIKRFLRALLQAESFVKNNRSEAINLISQDLQLDRGYLDKTWEESQFRLILNQNLIVTMEHEARWIIESGSVETTEVPNYLYYIYMDALEEVKPEAVRIIR
jgi:NitT/TauT family transport system substrate-binding protein